MALSPLRLTAADSTVVVVDIQDKLLAKMPTGPTLVRNAGFVLDVANLLGISVMGTEQYPQGLGPTTAEIARRWAGTRPPKTAFSCCGATGFLDSLRAGGRSGVVLVGMEAHVCVLHTALDLITAGFTVFLPVDAVASRYAVDHDIAVRRLERAGAVPTTAEAVAFEWVRDAAHPQFKAVSRLVIDRAAGSNSV